MSGDSDMLGPVDEFDSDPDNEADATDAEDDEPKAPREYEVGLSASVKPQEDDDDDDDDNASQSQSQSQSQSPSQRQSRRSGKGLRASRRSMRSMRSLASAVDEADMALQGYLKKGEWRAPEQCGCIPIRERQYKDKFVALDVKRFCVRYAKTRQMLLKVSSKSIPFSDIKTVVMEGESSGRFKVYLKRQVWGHFKGREYFSFAAVDSHTAKQWVAQLRDLVFLRATVYSIGADRRFPESELGVDPITAVCWSGGGARAHAASVGQLRALHHLGLLNKDDVSYISSVSGSSWSTVAYTFYREGAESDDELLGPVSSLQDLALERMRAELCPLLKPATVDMWQRAESLFWSVSIRQWWETTVGDVYLEPFGLNGDIPFGHPALEQAVRASNPQIKDVYLSRADRPFWVASAAVLGPSWGKSADIFPVQFTPLYSGTPFHHKMHLRGHKRMQPKELSVGLMIDSFAFGSEEPVSKKEGGVGGGSFRRHSLKGEVLKIGNAVQNVATDLVKEVFKNMEQLVKDHEEEVHRGVHKRLVRVPFPEQPLTLRHAVGIASHAPAVMFKGSRFGERLNIRDKIWSSSDKEAAMEVDLADGGVLDNLALLPMLQRGVGRVVVFVNSQTAVPMRPNSKVKRGVRDSMRKSVRKIRTSSRRLVPQNSSGLSASAVARARSMRSVPTDEALRDAANADSASVAGSRVSGGFSSAASMQGAAEREAAEREREHEHEQEEEVYEQTITDNAVSFVPEFADWPTSNLLPLFGIEVPHTAMYEAYSHNQVFKRSKIVDLLEQFQRKKLAQEPLVAIDTYTVLRNDWWGIPGGHEVTIMWHYTEKNRAFELQLPQQTLAEIDKGTKGHFPRFPLYKTFGTKRGKWIEPGLSPEQANLLAAFTEWSVLQSKATITHFLRDAAEESRQRAKAFMSDLEAQGFA